MRHLVKKIFKIKKKSSEQLLKIASKKLEKYKRQLTQEPENTVAKLKINILNLIINYLKNEMENIKND